MSDSPTPDRIMQLGLGFWGPRALLEAVQFGLFTELARGPRDAEHLAARLGLHRRGARNFLDALVALGVLEREGNLYRNTPETDLYLDRAKPTYVGGILEMAATRLWGSWGRLGVALRTGRPQSEAGQAGGDFFAALYADPDCLRQFLRAMTGLTLGAATARRRSSPGATTAASSISGSPRAPCRCRWPRPTRI